MDDLDREPLANLLDYEPELFLGATSSEVGTIVSVSTGVWLLFFVIIFLSIGLWLDLTSIAFMAVPCTAIAAFCSTVFLLKRLQKAKMNRPEGYHVILLRLHYQKISTKFGSKPHFETYTGTWGIERNDI